MGSSKLLGAAILVPLFALLTAPARVCAQQPPAEPPLDLSIFDPTPAEKQKARALFRTGAAAMDRADWKAAREALAEAWRLNPHYQIAGNLGICELELGAYRAAAEHLAFYVQFTPASPSDPTTRQAQTQLDRAMLHVAAIQIRVLLGGRRHPAAVRVDDLPLGAGDEFPTLYLDPGRHQIVATADRLRRVLDVEPRVGSTTTIEVELVAPAPVVPAPAHARLPPPPTAPDPRGSGGTTLEGAAIGAVLGIAGAGLAWGALFTVQANETSARIERSGARLRELAPTAAPSTECTNPDPETSWECGSLSRAVDSRRRYTGMAVGGFIAAGVAGAAGTAWLVHFLSRDASPRSEPRLTLAPAVGRGHAGASLQGSF